MTMTLTDRTHSSTPRDSVHITQRITEHDELELSTFKYTEHQLQDLEHDIDPDNNFFSSVNSNCSYYTCEQYNQSINTDGKLSLIHVNSRSLYANFNYIREYLHELAQPLNIITTSETWINADKGIDFELDGYEFRYVIRQNKVGGGVAMYVDKNLKSKVLDNVSSAIDNILECITIEIYKEKCKNVIISCVYGAPGSSIEYFKDWMECIFSKINHRTIFVCGDFNINLLNPDDHKVTEEFINTMYSITLYPRITRPSRIASHCATLIDNIFTNHIENNTVSGLFIINVSDHLPVFTVHNTNFKNNLPNKKTDYRRVRTEETINAIKNDLMSRNWAAVYTENDVNNAYETFLGIFKSLYDKNCPIKVYNRTPKYKSCPWITNGLKNACKKKNVFYRDFIKLRTKKIGK